MLARVLARALVRVPAMCATNETRSLSNGTVMARMSAAGLSFPQLCARSDRRRVARPRAIRRKFFPRSCQTSWSLSPPLSSTARLFIHERAIHTRLPLDRRSLSPVSCPSRGLPPSSCGALHVHYTHVASRATFSGVQKIALSLHASSRKQLLHAHCAAGSTT